MTMDLDAGPVTVRDGQSAQESQESEGTTQGGPVAEPAGQPATQQDSAAGTSQVGTPGGKQAGDEPGTFFDPRELPPELADVYKQMQASYTRKMQALSRERQKIEAYNAFMADPLGQMQQMAQRYGYVLSRPGEQPAAQQHAGMTQAWDGSIPPDWQPQTWGEVVQRVQQTLLPNIEQQIRAKLLQDLQPVLRTAHAQTVQNIERTFNELDREAGLPPGTWREFEDEMRTLLQEHPTLVNSPERLYRLALPDEIIRTQAMQRALRRLEARTKSTAVDTKSSVARTTATGREIKSFDDAVRAAREQLGQGR